MTQEKNILIQDLCSRLPYGVIVQDRNGIHPLTAGNTEFTDLLYGNKCNIKPYLRRKDTMTQEEQKVYRMYEYFDKIKSIDYLYSIHVDAHDLIPNGLALEAPKNMYNK